ncbi:MAG: DUF3606 domain-containing protein [Usitatibacter sp.]
MNPENGQQQRAAPVDEVDFGDPAEVAPWTRSLGVNEDALLEAVKAEGTSFGRVYGYVIRNRGR